MYKLDDPYLQWLCSVELVSSPDPTLKEGKGSGDFGIFSWFGRLWAHMLTQLPLRKAQIWLVSKDAWVIQICIAGNGAFTLLRLASHMTKLKLWSDWGMQIPPRVIKWTSFLPKVTRPFPLLEGGVWGRDYRWTCAAHGWTRHGLSRFTQAEYSNLVSLDRLFLLHFSWRSR